VTKMTLRAKEGALAERPKRSGLPDGATEWKKEEGDMSKFVPERGISSRAVEKISGRGETRGKTEGGSGKKRESSVEGGDKGTK